MPENTAPAGSIQESWTHVVQLPDSGWDVTIALSGMPLQFVLHFDERRGDEGLELECTRAEVGPHPPSEHQVVAVSSSMLDELAKRFERLERHARSAIAGMLQNGEDLMPAPRTRRELSPSFLADVARRHAEHRERGLSPTQTLAREEGVSVGTVKYWLRRAREEGAVERSGEEES